MNQEFQSSSVAIPSRVANPFPAPQVVFLFPGEGSQKVDMARPLYDTEPEFRAAVDACATFLQPLLKHDLRETLFPSEEERDHAERDIQRPIFTQPCVFTVSYAFASLWISRGVRPSHLIGQGVGEYVAAVIAKTFTLENALTLLACRARLMQDLPAGGMLAIHSSPDRLTLPDGIDLASIDGADRCTVSGPRETIHTYRKSLEARSITCRSIRSSHAFHSAAMDPILRTFTGDAAMIPCNPPSIPWISTCTGRMMDEETLADPAYWAHQLRQPVDIHGALTTVFAEENIVLLEVGAGHALASLALRHPARNSTPVISSHSGTPLNLTNVDNALAELRKAGVEIAPTGTAPEPNRVLSPSTQPTPLGHPKDPQEPPTDFSQIESVLESHPSVCQASTTVRNGRLIAYLRTVATTPRLDATPAGPDDATVERILNYGPRRIYEIGCSSGKLLTHLAPTAECYWASDTSLAAIEALGNSLTLPHVRLSHRPADDFSGLPIGDFDTVIIHSVAQRFPDAATLSRVLEGAGKLLATGGRIFLTDLVGSALLPILHSASLTPRVPEGTTVGQLRESVAIRVSRETALAVDPAWFDHLLLRITDLGPVEILVRRGAAAGEEDNHHYDVILHKQPNLRLQPLPPATAWGNLNLEQLEAILHSQPKDLHLTDIPNAHLAADVAFHRALTAAPADHPLPPPPHCPATAASVDDLFQLAAQAGFTAHVRWQGDGASGLLEAALIHDQPGALPAWPRIAAPLPPAALVNKPHPPTIPVAPDLCDYLATRLPHHLIPSSFVVVDHFPLTPEGKVNHDALPLPVASARSVSSPLVPATNSRESRLLEIWKQVLGRDEIGTTDDIFDLGGDSILVFQIAVRANRDGLAITPAQILRLRTVAAIVAEVSELAR